MRVHLNQPIRSTDWNGLRVWLIGASSGIGAALAQQLCKMGVQLILSARRRDALDEVVSKCRAGLNTRHVLSLPLDICDPRATQLAVNEVKALWSGVDIVIFNAGTYEATRIDTLSSDSAERSLRVNLLAPIQATATILPLLLSNADDQKPRGFAYVASVAGYRGLPRALTYGPGKAGLMSFAESLWVDLNGMGINTWLINPGFVRTQLTAQNDFEMPALIEPAEAAAAIIKGFASGSFEIHFPKRFSWFMKLLRVLPIGIYLRLIQRLVPPLTRPNASSRNQ